MKSRLAYVGVEIPLLCELTGLAGLRNILVANRFNSVNAINSYHQSKLSISMVLAQSPTTRDQRLLNPTGTDRD